MIDFWFDFGSPYAYLAGEQIDALAAAHGRTVRWRPFLLFAVLRELELPAPMAHPARRDYLLLDIERSARVLGLPYRQPTRFPVITPLPARLFFTLAQTDAAAAARFAREALRAAFAQDQPLDDTRFVGELAARHGGGEASALLAAAEAEPARAALRQSVADAVAQRVFGSPFTVCDGEPFFGADRLPQLAARLSSAERP